MHRQDQTLRPEKQPKPISHPQLLKSINEKGLILLKCYIAGNTPMLIVEKQIPDIFAAFFVLFQEILQER